MYCTWREGDDILEINLMKTLFGKLGNDGILNPNSY